MSWHPVLTPSPSGSLRIWDPPRDGLEYVAGIDVSEGRKRDITQLQRRGVAAYSDHRPDYSAIVVLELTTGLHVATWHGYVPPSELASIAAGVGAHYNNALLVPELNGPGLAVVTRLNETLHYDNIYRSQLVNMVDVDPLLPRFGWQTTPSSRKILIMHISVALMESRLWTRDSMLVRELRTMEFDDQGNERSRGTNKDDLVFALALALEGRHRTLGLSPADRQPKLPPDRAYDSRVWNHVKRRLEANQHGSNRSTPGRSGLFPRRSTGDDLR
jgi:hypothetical protein